MSSPSPVGLTAAALGFRPRFAPVAGALDSAATALGGRPGFFFVKGSSAAAFGAALGAALDVGKGMAFLSVFVGALLADLAALGAGLAGF
jgi:hypothetical protein